MIKIFETKDNIYWLDIDIDKWFAERKWQDHGLTDVPYEISTEELFNRAKYIENAQTLMGWYV